ncbi:hypothetical protein HOD75_03035 [archaeon]|jgi:uncharacterized protein|nr:hypothetical protein [archaeon]MBT4241848.1 hypothetical protein [archaeon]MBT4418395.1 hypothetical protein [archaeon]
MPTEIRKRETAHKLRIGDLLKGNQVYEEDSEKKRLRFIEIGDKQVLRINLIANVIDKYISEGERKFGSITLDDGSGQIRARAFAEDLEKFNDITQGDTLLVIGLLRAYNEEIYIIPEILKKQDPKYLLVRKLEIEKSFPKPLTTEKKEEIKSLRDELMNIIKESESQEGIDKEEIILKLKSEPDLINQEINKLLEEGIVYEPRPGRVRYLG